MDIIVNYGELNKAVTAAKNVGVPSTKDPLQRFDCVTFQVKKGYLRVGGIGPDTSFVTHLKPKQIDVPGDGVPVHVKNQDWMLVKKLGITSKQGIRIRTTADTMMFSAPDDDMIAVTVTLETAKVHEPDTDGDTTDDHQDVPWEERVRVMSMVGDSKLWLTLPNAALLVQGIEAALVASAPWSASELPFHAEVVRLQVIDTPGYAHDLINYQSGRVLAIMGTDRRRTAQTFIPLVRRGKGEPATEDVLIGHTEVGDDEASVEIFVPVKAAKVLRSLLDGAHQTRLRIMYHRKDDKLTPMTLVVTNGPSLIRVNIDMSGSHTNRDMLQYLDTQVADLNHGFYGVDRTTIKKLEIVAGVRGVENSGLNLQIVDNSITVVAQEAGGQAQAELTLVETKDAGVLSVWVDPAPFVAIMKFLLGASQFSVHSLNDGKFIDFRVPNTRILTSTATN